MDNIIINQLIENLSWEMPEDKQLNAIQKLSELEPEKCHLLINPMLKSTWENATLVIEKIGYPRNKAAIPSLIWLFQDLNWPGVDRAFSILTRVDKCDLIPLLEDAIEKAYVEKDYMWLGGIKRFLESCRINEKYFINKDIYKLLIYADF